jgi:phage shock protein PspC (stress-responsive transcriptional regulator)
MGGVCAGLADALGWDATVVRLLWVFAFLITSGAALLVYLLLWLLLPVGTQSDGRLRDPALNLGGEAGSRTAILLLVLGGLWLLANLGILPDMGRMVDLFLRVFFWPLVVLGLGLWLLRQSDPDALRRVGDGLRRGADSLRSQAATLRSSRSPAAAPDGDSAHTRASESATGDPVRAASTGAGERSLVRRRDDRMVLGVAAAMGHWLGIDPVLSRLLWVVGILASAGFGLVLYMAAAIVIPQEESAAFVAPGGESDLSAAPASDPLPGDGQPTPTAADGAAAPLEVSAANAGDGGSAHRDPNAIVHF